MEHHIHFYQEDGLLVVVVEKVLMFKV